MLQQNFYPYANEDDSTKQFSRYVEPMAVVMADK